MTDAPMHLWSGRFLQRPGGDHARRAHGSSPWRGQGRVACTDTAARGYQAGEYRSHRAHFGLLRERRCSAAIWIGSLILFAAPQGGHDVGRQRFWCTSLFVDSLVFTPERDIVVVPRNLAGVRSARKAQGASVDARLASERSLAP